MVRARGPWSVEEKNYIRDNAGSLTPEEIAVEINRNPEAVKRYMTKNGLMKFYTSEQIKRDSSFTNLTKSAYWKNLSEQFTHEELQMFQYHWQNTAKQFNDDILHTEEIQIVDMIKFEILMNRLLSKEIQITREIEELNNLLAAERMKKDKDIEALKYYTALIDSMYKSIEQIQRDYGNLHTSKSKIFSALKATREQRIKQIENSKESFVDWVKELVKNPELRRSLGIYMEKHRIATEVEYKRLSELHEFDDGVVEPPILNQDYRGD